MTRLEILKAELADVERLDKRFWQTRNPERYERIAYFVRQERRPKLVEELLQIMQQESMPSE